MSGLEKISLNITSEYGPLKTVIVHRPGLEIDMLTPENKNILLFEDIPYLQKMQEEHKRFVGVLEQNGVSVLFLEDLLKDILVPETGSTDRIVQRSCIMNQSLAPIILNNYTKKDICKIILGGLTSGKLKEDTGIDFSSINSDEDEFLLEPVPNAYFTRDPAAVIGNKVVSSKMQYDVRVRETYFYQEIFTHHKYFKNMEPHDEDDRKSNFIFGDRVLQDEERPYCIEGGDIIVLHEKAIAIGCSQRTRAETIHKLAVKLFRYTNVQKVYQINIPAERAYMHLDTVFTVVDKGKVVAYPNVMNQIKEIIRFEPHLPYNSSRPIAIPILENRPFNKILEDEFGRLQVIHTGDNISRYASREQLADGTNVFAIAPGKVITYDRNIYTNNALKKAGVDVISIEGSELVRGLGGPRCMTMPIYRENV